MELSEKIQRLRDKADKSALGRKSDYVHSRIGRMEKDIGSLARFTNQLAQGLWWIWSYIGLPIWRFIKKVYSRLSVWYRRVWSLVVYKRDQYGVLVFKRSRAGLMLLFSFIIAPALLWFTVEFTVDLSFYLATVHHNEHVILNKSEEIAWLHEVHNAKGCHQSPCDPTDTIYFRIQGSLFHDIWSLIHKRELFYPEYVAAAVPDVPTECVVTSYGLRLRVLNFFPFTLLTKQLGIFPYLLDVSCKVKP